MAMAGTTEKNWREAAAVYCRPRVVALAFLGFSAGLPFLLVFSTLSAWLRDEGLSLATIGFFSWIGITYSIKVFWAPVVDRTPLFILTRRLGKRRSWMLSAQILIALGLLGMALCDPQAQLRQIAVFALLVAFGSATQDIAIDAYRIEAADKLLQGALAASYVFGYRVALLAAGAGAFYIAAAQTWQTAYVVMAGLMGVGIVTTLIVAEPTRPPVTDAERIERDLSRRAGVGESRSLPARAASWFISAAVSPFVEFFNRNGLLALAILSLIATFRISDITMGVMANPFYLDLGFSKTEIANITKIYGFFMTIIGAGLGGIVVLRYGLLRPLLAGALLVPVANLFFVWLAVSEPDLTRLALVISADNLSGGFATSVFIAYLSSLTNTAYTATQYALFSSLMTLPAKIIGGFSGIVVEAVGYAWFFLYAGALGLPAVLLILYLTGRERQAAAPAGAASPPRPGAA